VTRYALLLQSNVAVHNHEKQLPSSGTVALSKQINHHTVHSWPQQIISYSET
jgi:hypothetical protein